MNSSEEPDVQTATQLVGCVLGTAVGDAMGLPYEGLSPARAAKLLGPPDRYRFAFGRGMVSDDTDHTCMVAQSLIAADGNLDLFIRQLSRRLQVWLFTLPAGVGLATLRSIVRLWIGFSPQTSGVFSAGNGPSMRAAILGAAIDNRRTLREFVRASTRMTHTDPKAEYGAMAIALAAQLARGSEPISVDQYVTELKTILGDEGEELVSSIADAATAAGDANTPTESFAASMGLANGVSGYTYHCVPVAIHAWLLHPHDFRAAITSVIRCGGDTDSTAAIVGGIVGVAVGKEGIPAEWLDQLMEWPRSVAWMERLGVQVASSIRGESAVRPFGLPAWGLLPRNLFFLMVVLFHGFRRLLPPY